MIDWLERLRATQPIGHGIAVLCFAAALGLLLGRARFRGVGLGIAGVLFVAIAFGHSGINVDAKVRAFLQEFGLILFVYTIGMQLGPGFVASLRKDGLLLNGLAAGIVVAGAIVATVLGLLMRSDVAATAGIFAGATTNTPALGAAQQALSAVSATPGDRDALPGLAYAVAYPIGISGIIASLLILKRIFRVDLLAEVRRLAAATAAIEAPGRASVRVENVNLDGMPVAALPGLAAIGVVVSRIKRSASASTEIARDDTVVHVGDVLLVVGSHAALEACTRIVGSRADVDMLALPSTIVHRRVVVTRTDVLGRRIGQLSLDARFGVRVTRLARTGAEMTASDDLELKFGDRLDIVGDAEGIERAAGELGNSVKALDETQFVPMFLGIALGVLGGLVPIVVPGLPVPVRLGLAGGPLIAALILSRIGHAGTLVWHMPANVNIAFRELGITLFLACVGLKAGERFVETALSAQGAGWALAAVAVTMVPLLLAGIVARRVFKLDFMTIMGLVAGSTTDPPALAFATGVAGSDAPTAAYATVYPLTMVLRILAAQVLIVAFA